jgi:hypothetical protein
VRNGQGQGVPGLDEPGPDGDHEATSLSLLQRSGCTT